MPRVTIGVPVYNAESLLEQCLENLAAQTFRDFKVIVLDNASTDGTAAVAERFAARDPRFTYRRQPHNKGARQNFADVLDMADTPYFIWRADDDLTDLNFIEETVRLLDAEPTAALAVGVVVSDKNGRTKRRPFPARGALEPALSHTLRLLFRSHPSWTYGLFRTVDLKHSFGDVRTRFKHLIASDHLTLFPFLVTRRVVGSNATTFTQRFRPSSAAKHPLRDPADMLALRRDFSSFCENDVRALVPAGLSRLVLLAAVKLYAGRSYRWPKILGAALRVRRGETPSVNASSGRYEEGTAPVKDTKA